MATPSLNLVWHQPIVERLQRARQKSQRPCVIWFTGLSGSGKSTMANALDNYLYSRGMHTYLLDGDNMRHGLNSDLRFSDADRAENIRRVGEVAKLLVDAGLIVLCTFISPFQRDRDAVRTLIKKGEFLEIYVKADLEVCERQDVKGLYKKARAGQIKSFTGIDSPYEPPIDPDVSLDTAANDVDHCLAELIGILESRQSLKLA